MWRRAIGTWALALTAACGARFEPATAPAPALVDPLPVSIERVELRYSNVYLLRSRAGGVALVDSGSPGDEGRITGALAGARLRPSDVKVVVLTHGHGDHAGLGRFFQRTGAKIVLGRGDELQSRPGKNDEMTPTSPLAFAVRPFFRLDYDPFEPDLLVDDELDLARFDLPGVKAKRMPGHTRGSLVVLAGPRDALVGDQMLGGVWGGLFHGGSAGQHYYQLDADRNECNVHALLEQGIETFHVGHGGPLSRDSVLEWAKGWDGECAPERRPGPPPTFPMCRRAYP